MADITMCDGKLETEELDEVHFCPRREECYRFTAPSSPYRQSYFVDAPGKQVDGRFSCEYYWDNKLK